MEIGHRVATVCHLTNIAIKVGRKLKWNPQNERFIGNATLNAMLDRKRRGPYDCRKFNPNGRRTQPIARNSFTLLSIPTPGQPRDPPRACRPLACD